MSAQLVTIELFDANDCKIGEVQMPARTPAQRPRLIAYQGKHYIEGGEGGYYSENQAGESEIKVPLSE